MRENHALTKMRQGKQLVGTFLETNDTNTVEALGVAGLDFLVVDFEHGMFTTESLLHIVQAADLRDMTPFVRVKEITRPEILRPLDMGVQGLIIPNIRTLEEVENVIRWGKYAPAGDRGLFTSRVSDFGFSGELDNFAEFANKNNQETLLIPQCETKESLEIIEDIVALEQVSGIFVGPFDLSIALGIPTQFDHPIFQAALERIYNAIRKHNKFAFIFGMNAKSANGFIEAGYDAVVCGFDTSILIEATMGMIQSVKGQD